MAAAKLTKISFLGKIWQLFANSLSEHVQFCERYKSKSGYNIMLNVKSMDSTEMHNWIRFADLVSDPKLNISEIL